MYRNAAEQCGRAASACGGQQHCHAARTEATLQAVGACHWGQRRLQGGVCQACCIRRLCGRPTSLQVQPGSRFAALGFSLDGLAVLGLGFLRCGVCFAYVGQLCEASCIVLLLLVLFLFFLLLLLVLVALVLVLFPNLELRIWKCINVACIAGIGMVSCL